MPATKSESLRIGIDIGGTFTDLLAFNEATGRFTIGKTLTTPDDPARAVQTGVAKLIADAGAHPRDVDQIVHGTTLVTNALIERKGAKTALITTAGFRDALEIAREHRYDLYDLFLELPKPLVPRSLRFEINERLFADGSVHKPLDESEAAALIGKLKNAGIEAVAVSLIHSYQNPTHERQIARLLEELAPEMIVSVSSDVVPELREYERTSTTVSNVYVRPIIVHYLNRLIEELHTSGVTGSFFVMLSSGGVCTPETASNYPIRLVESGPAAGALAAAHIGRLTGRPSLLSFDMGGTTAKCCIIDDGKPTVSAEFEVNRVYRFKKGSGLPVRVPVIDMIEIGAGGGSIARADAMGLLKVGPDSSGADPGPACYGRGGAAPTVTDADLLLGCLDPGFFLGGEMALDVGAARAAVAGLGERLDMTPVETAWGIHEVVNEQMAGAARMHAIENGKDPRQYPVFAFGGAGPVHAYRVAEILGSPELIVPLGAGVASTIGFLVAPLAFDFVRSFVGRLDSLDWSEVNARFNEMEREGREILAKAGVVERDITLTRTAELRYVGQGHQVVVPAPDGFLDRSSAATLELDFEETYRRLYGRTAAGNSLEAINWRVIATAEPPALQQMELGEITGGGTVDEAVKGRRALYLRERGGFVETPVYDRYRLPRGATFAGPAIIEERESTLVVGLAPAIRVDDFSNVIVTMPSRESA